VNTDIFIFIVYSENNNSSVSLSSLYSISDCTNKTSRVRAGNFVICVMLHLPVPYVCKCMGILLLPFFFFFSPLHLLKHIWNSLFFPFTPPLSFSSSLPLFSFSLSLLFPPPLFNLLLKSFLLWSDLNGVGLRIAFFLFSSFCRFLFVQISFISTSQSIAGVIFGFLSS